MGSRTRENTRARSLGLVERAFGLKTCYAKIELREALI
jgi:hypothetical protein